MGLMDILNGMQNGPRGKQLPKQNTGGGGMSPLMMALLALLAYNALKGKGAQPSAPDKRIPPASGPSTAGAPGGSLGDILGGLLGGRGGGVAKAGKPGGNLNDILAGGLGGLLGGAGAGSVLSGGLGNLIRDLQQSGQGHAVQSW